VNSLNYKTPQWVKWLVAPLLGLLSKRVQHMFNTVYTYREFSHFCSTGELAELQDAPVGEVACVATAGPHVQEVAAHVQRWTFSLQVRGLFLLFKNYLCQKTSIELLSSKAAVSVPLLYIVIF
jgi:hypothetical protein